MRQWANALTLYASDNKQTLCYYDGTSNPDFYWLVGKYIGAGDTKYWGTTAGKARPQRVQLCPSEPDVTFPYHYAPNFPHVIAYPDGYQGQHNIFARRPWKLTNIRHSSGTIVWTESRLNGVGIANVFGYAGYPPDGDPTRLGFKTSYMAIYSYYGVRMPYNNIGLRHGNRRRGGAANVGFLDGHAELIDLRTLADPSNLNIMWGKYLENNIR